MAGRVGVLGAAHAVEEQCVPDQGVEHAAEGGPVCGQFGAVLVEDRAQCRDRGVCAAGSVQFGGQAQPIPGAGAPGVLRQGDVEEFGEGGRRVGVPALLGQPVCPGTQTPFDPAAFPGRERQAVRRGHFLADREPFSAAAQLIQGALVRVEDPHDKFAASWLVASHVSGGVGCLLQQRQPGLRRGMVAALVAEVEQRLCQVGLVDVVVGPVQDPVRLDLLVGAGPARSNQDRACPRLEFVAHGVLAANGHPFSFRPGGPASLGG
ncbi:hypothetical protein AB0M46_22950 [Dactylosporangium sp. NPDC051485]|uniref:hypothetical protein n=1 Tax=Dactylosporangium sp. NPDC051485 TaxID=3154846 RepID=UPI003413C1A3